MTGVKVKICGLTEVNDALDAVELGADYLGFNFYPESPRFIQPEVAMKIFEEIPGNIPKVGVFVNTVITDVLDVAIELGLDFLQFHGDESPQDLNGLGRPWFKAFRLKNMSDLDQIPEYDCDWILLDAYSDTAYGGTGMTAQWDLVRAAKNFEKKIFLAGGINPENVEVALQTVKPWAIDVASGVEQSPGIKDRRKMETLIIRAKGVKY